MVVMVCYIRDMNWVYLFVFVFYVPLFEVRFKESGYCTLFLQFCSGGSMLQLGVQEAEFRTCQSGCME